MAPFECDGPLVAGGHQLYRLTGSTLATVFRLPTSGRRQPGYKVDPETGLDVPDDTFDGGRMSRSVSQPSSGTSHALTIAESAREKLAAGPSLAPQGKRVCACAKHSPAGPALPARSERRPCCASTYALCMHLHDNRYRVATRRDLGCWPRPFIGAQRQCRRCHTTDPNWATVFVTSYSCHIWPSLAHYLRKSSVRPSLASAPCNNLLLWPVGPIQAFFSSSCTSSKSS